MSGRGAGPDVALAVWSYLARALAPFGIAVDPLVLGILRSMRAQGVGVFGADGLLRAEVVDGLASVAAQLRRYAGDPGPPVG